MIRARKIYKRGQGMTSGIKNTGRSKTGSGIKNTPFSKRRNQSKRNSISKISNVTVNVNVRDLILRHVNNAKSNSKPVIKSHNKNPGGGRPSMSSVRSKLKIDRTKVQRNVRRDRPPFRNVDRHGGRKVVRPNTRNHFIFK